MIGRRGEHHVTRNRKPAAKKPAKKKVSAFSTRKVDPAYYWMVVPAAIIFAFFLYLPFLDGVKYSFTNSQGYGDYKFIGLKNYIALFQDNRVGHATCSRSSSPFSSRC